MRSLVTPILLVVTAALYPAKLPKDAMFNLHLNTHKCGLVYTNACKKCAISCGHLGKNNINVQNENTKMRMCKLYMYERNKFLMCNEMTLSCTQCTRNRGSALIDQYFRAPVASIVLLPLYPIVSNLSASNKIRKGILQWVQHTKN